MKPISFFWESNRLSKIRFIQCDQQSKRPQTFVTHYRVILLVRGVSGSQECVNQCQSSVKYGNASRLDKHTFEQSRVVFVQNWTRNILGGEKRAITTFLTVWRAPVGTYYPRLCSFSYEVRSKVKCCCRSKTFRKLIRRLTVVWIAGSRFISWVNPSAAQVALSWKYRLAKETQFYFQEMRLAKFNISETPKKT